MAVGPFFPVDIEELDDALHVANLYFHEKPGELEILELASKLEEEFVTYFPREEIVWSESTRKLYNELFCFVQKEDLDFRVPVRRHYFYEPIEPELDWEIYLGEGLKLEF